MANRAHSTIIQTVACDGRRALSPEGKRAAGNNAWHRYIFTLDYCWALRLYSVFPLPGPSTAVNRRLQTIQQDQIP